MGHHQEIGRANPRAEEAGHKIRVPKDDTSIQDDLMT